MVGADTEKVSKEKALASEEEKKVQIINEDVTKKQKACQDDLVKAEPALVKAKEALSTLNKVSQKFQIVIDRLLHLIKKS